MDSDELRIHGKRMIDYVADYWDNMREHGPMYEVEPGYIKALVPTTAPLEPESWDTIFADIEPVVLKGNTHWHHPQFYAYFPTANSYAAIMGDILSDGLGCIGFTWHSSPACTELEMSVMDWLAKMIGLPDMFLHSAPGFGAGMIQCTASDSTLIAMLSARRQAALTMNRQWTLADWTRALKHVPKRALDRMSEWWTKPKASEPVEDDGQLYFPGLIAYCSEQSHSSVEKAALLSAVRLRKLPTYAKDDYALKAHTVREAIEEDLARGMTPFFVCATVGTTNLCAFDDAGAIGKVCEGYGIWCHVDAAYAGSAAVCPEYQNLLAGLEHCDSFNFNAHKWLMVNFDCAPMWFRDTRKVEESMVVNPLYLKHDYDNEIADFRMCSLAQVFDGLVRTDSRFEVTRTALGLVCFRMKGENKLSEFLMNNINKDKRIHLVPAKVHDTYFLRLAICSQKTTEDDLHVAFDVIKEMAELVLQ